MKNVICSKSEVKEIFNYVAERVQQAKSQRDIFTCNDLHFANKDLERVYTNILSTFNHTSTNDFVGHISLIDLVGSHDYEGWYPDEEIKAHRIMMLLFVSEIIRTGGL